jgi:polysaccharide export outer membrane protein
MHHTLLGAIIETECDIESSTAFQIFCAVLLISLVFTAPFIVTTQAAEVSLGRTGIVLAQSSGGGTRADQIGVHDLLQIEVFNVPDLSTTLQVADTGTINYPLLGEISVAGKTAREVEQDLAAKLGAEYLQNPQVSVFVKESNSRNITISGAVKKPGVYPLTSQTSLLQAIAIAGDLGDAAENTVLILRQAGRKQSAAKFDVKAIKSGKMADPFLRAGDRIVVGESAIKKSYNFLLKTIPVLARFAIFL